MILFNQLVFSLLNKAAYNIAICLGFPERKFPSFQLPREKFYGRYFHVKNKIHLIISNTLLTIILSLLRKVNIIF